MLILLFDWMLQQNHNTSKHVDEYKAKFFKSGLKSPALSILRKVLIVTTHILLFQVLVNSVT